MPDSALISILTALAGIMAPAIGWLAWQETHRGNLRDREVERIKSVVQAALEPVTAKQYELDTWLRETNTRLDQCVSRQDQLSRDLRDYAEKQDRVLERLVRLETQTEVFWKSVAMDAAKIIHSPDPARQHIDVLLEAFMDGTITPEQQAELRKILLIMRDWEPGAETDFPVYPGEQVAAAILLRTMEYALSGGK